MRFIFTLTDTGCLVVTEQEGRILSEGFYTSVDVFETSDDYHRLQQESSAPIHIFLDTQDQIYTRESLPKINPLAKYRLLKHKCRTNAPRTHHRTYLEELNGRVLFVDVHLSEAHVDWLHFAEEQPNPLKAVRLLPLEIESLLAQSPLKESAPTTPCLILSYQHPDGLRQSVFHHKMFHVKRLVPLPQEKPQEAIPTETGQLVHYLTNEGGLAVNDIGVLGIGPLPATSALPLDHQKLYIPSEEEVPHLSLSPLSLLTVLAASNPPSLSLRLKAMAVYHREDLYAKMLMGASVACALALFWGGLYLYAQKGSLTRAIKEMEGGLMSYEHTLNKADPLSAYAAFSKESQLKKTKLLDRYDRLRQAMPNPFTMLQDISPWLKEHWMLRNFEWRYVSPKFKKDAWVLDQSTRTYEAMDLWLDYLGANHLQAKARDDQIRQPLQGYQVSRRTHMKEFEVVHIEREGDAL